MRGVFIIFGLVLALIAASFLPQVKEYRAEKAVAHFEQGDLKAAKRWYFFGKLQGDVQAANNYHVINYRLARYDETVSDKKATAIRKKSFRGFDKLTQKGFVPAAYNAGMFYYRSSANSGNFVKGLQYFDFAAQSGDEMSRHAADMMRSKGLDKEAKLRVLRKSADGGNGYAAYKYANALRHDKKKLRTAEKYALMGAEAGYADAQAFLGIYFPRRKDAEDWLKKAATNPENRNMRAPLELAEIARKRRDTKERRKWLTLGATPREKFTYKLVAASDGLRWRGLQSTINSGVNNDKAAAYKLAKMQMDGIGGPVDKTSAIKNLEKADGWEDAELILARLKAGASYKTSHKVPSKSLVDAELKAFERFKNRSYYNRLRALIKNRQLRFATDEDVKKYAQGVSKYYSNEKTGFRTKGNVSDCSVGSNCFYMASPIILPPDMFGANSATFIVGSSFILPKQNLSHNRYIFANERNVPR